VACGYIRAHLLFKLLKSRELHSEFGISMFKLQFGTYVFSQQAIAYETEVSNFNLMRILRGLMMS
jgi:hypothetical protein